MKAPNPMNPTPKAAAQEDHRQPASNTPRTQAPGLAALIDCDRAALALLMENRPPSGAAFDAQWHAKYLDSTIELIRKILLSDDLVAPLRDISHRILTTGAPATSDDAAYPQHEVDFIHAYAAAEISYLVFSGVDEQNAAQLVTKQLIVHNVPLPAGGGDPRGWMRLLKWRATMRQKRNPSAVYEQYEGPPRHTEGRRGIAAGTERARLRQSAPPSSVSLQSKPTAPSAPD